MPGAGAIRRESVSKTEGLSQNAIICPCGAAGCPAPAMGLPIKGKQNVTLRKERDGILPQKAR